MRIKRWQSTSCRRYRHLAKHRWCWFLNQSAQLITISDVAFNVAFISRAIRRADKIFTAPEYPLILVFRKSDEIKASSSRRTARWFRTRRGKRRALSAGIAGEFWRRKLRRVDWLFPSRLRRGPLDGYLCISLFPFLLKAVLRGGASPWHSAPRRACHHVSALEAHSHTALRHDDVADGRVDAEYEYPDPGVS